MKFLNARLFTQRLHYYWQKLLYGSDTGFLFQAHQVVRQIVTFSLAVLLAKSVLGLREIGIYEQLFFLGHLLTFFWLDSLFKGFMAQYPFLEAAHRNPFLRHAAGLMIGLTLLMLAFSFVYAAWLIDTFTGGGIPLRYWWIFAGFVLIYQVSQFTEYIYLVWKHPRGLRSWMLFSHIGMLLFVAVPLFTIGTLAAVLWGLCGYGLLRLLWFLILAKPILWPESAILKHLRSWLSVTWPLAVYSLFAGAVWVIDGWIINTHYEDPGYFALYRYGARELPFSNILAATLGTVFIQYIAETGSTSFPELKHRIRRMAHVFFPVTILLMMLTEPLYEWVFSTHFAESAPVFRIYLFILVSRLVITSPLFTAYKHTRPIMWIGFLELIINAGLSLWWVNLWGISGVAWATIVAFTFEKVAHLWWLHKRLGIQPGDFVPIREILIYSGLLMLAYLMV